MVKLVRRNTNGNTYFYLEHNVRIEGRIVKRTKYLGKSEPKDVEAEKSKFLYEIDKEVWIEGFHRIAEQYRADQDRMPPSAKKKELKTFSISYTYNTNRIEGSTLTLRETADLLETGLTPSKRPLSDVEEAKAHDQVFMNMLEYEKDLSLQCVLSWHRDLFTDTKPDIAGSIRRHQVAISASRFEPPMYIELEFLLDELFKWYKREKGKLDPVTLAALVHLKFVTIHPFSDGNGRISRLMMNFVLNRNGFPMLDIEYSNRSSYYNALERSQVTGDERPFILWFYRTYKKKHSIYLDLPDK